MPLKSLFFNRQLVLSFILFITLLSAIDLGNATNPYQVVKAEYQKQQIRISYPRITNLQDTGKQKGINEIIKKEALKGLNYYLGDTKGLTLNIQYHITWMGPNLLSIQYQGLGYTKGAAHPNQLFYTTNLDIQKARKIRLKDVIRIDRNLVKRLKDKKFKPLTPELADMFEDIPSDDLIKSLDNADSLDNIGTEDQSDIFSYFTKKSLGISFGAGYAAGGHGEFEIPYKDIRNNVIKNELWKDF